jgi:hypothetical protein
MSLVEYCKAMQAYNQRRRLCPVMDVKDPQYPAYPEIDLNDVGLDRLLGSIATGPALNAPIPEREPPAFLKDFPVVLEDVTISCPERGFLAMPLFRKITPPTAVTCADLDRKVETVKPVIVKDTPWPWWKRVLWYIAHPTRRCP